MHTHAQALRAVKRFYPDMDPEQQDLRAEEWLAEEAHERQWTEDTPTAFDNVPDEAIALRNELREA